MSLSQWWHHPCRFGHKWMYKFGTAHPFYSGCQCFWWRGCTRCHHTEYEDHHSGMLYLWQTEWYPVPNLRIERNWNRFQHPSGWDSF